MTEHNDPTYAGTRTTKRLKGPWKLIWTEEFQSRREAMEMEEQIKNRGISRFLADLKE